MSIKSGSPAEGGSDRSQPPSRGCNQKDPKKPDISVVIPLYNKEPYIARAVSSVLHQTMKDFELLVVDDGSTDHGAEVVLGFHDPRVHLIRQENQGASVARNRGAAVAEASLIAFLDADDEWLPEHLETIERLATEYPEAQAMATSYVIVEPNGQEVQPTYRAIPPPPWEGLLPNYFHSARVGDYPFNSSVFCIRNDVFSRLGGYPPGASYGEDADLWGRVAARHPIAFSWRVGAKYRRDATNRACLRHSSLERDPFVRTAEQQNLANLVPEQMREEFLEYLYKLEFNRAQLNIQAGRTDEACWIVACCPTTKQRRRRYSLWIMARLPHKVFKAFWNMKRTLAGLFTGVDYSEDPWFK